MKHSLPRLIMAILSCCLLMRLWGCGGGGDEEQLTPYNPLWVYINATTNTVDRSPVDLSGDAYCEACPPSEVGFGACPNYQIFLPSAVNITWANSATGENGAALHGIYGSCSCLFSYCFTSYRHRWFASVPLAAGENSISVKAEDGSGNSQAESVTLTYSPAPP